MDKLAYTIDGLKAAGGPGRTKTNAAINDGKLKAKKLGKKPLILAPDAREYLKNLPYYEPKTAA